MTCLDGDHTMTHCNPVQCGVPLVIAHATPLGCCFVTITHGEQVEYQCEADYLVDSALKSGSKPEGCHAKERAELEQPVQAPEDPVNAVSSCRHVDLIEEKFASWIGQQDRLFPSHEPRQMRRNVSVDSSRHEPSRHEEYCWRGVSLPNTPEESSWSVTCEKWKDAKLVELILTRQGCLRQTSV